MNLPMRAHGFKAPFAGANGARTIPVSEHELLWAAVSVGYPTFSPALRPGMGHRAWALVFRCALILGYLDQDNEGRIVQSEEYLSADQSEKGAISYYLGLVAARLFTWRLLGIHLLEHWDSYRRRVNQPGSLRSRPDLIGETITGDRLVLVEAKGRTHGYRESLVQKAKDQANAVATVVRPDRTIQTPDARVALVAWFESGRWAVRADDPKGRGIQLTTSRDILEGYFDSTIAFVKIAEEGGLAQVIDIEGEQFRAGYDPDVGMAVGLSSRLWTDALPSRPSRRSVSAILSRVLPDSGPADSELFGVVVDGRGRDWFVGGDGLISRRGEL